jgi:hypothetical protein
VILSLLGSAAALPLNTESTRDAISVIETLPTDQHYQYIEKRQFWDYVGASLQSNLPGLLRWVADNLTWALKWQEQPVKRTKLEPFMDMRAHRSIFRYGPWPLTGANVRARESCLEHCPDN